MMLLSVLVIVLTSCLHASAEGRFVLKEEKIVAEGTTECTAQNSIIIEQRNLGFDHPATAITVALQCSCSATNIRAECDSEWLQGYTDASKLLVLGNGSCLLLPANGLPAHGLFTFIYEHSPPLQILPTQASFDCSSSHATEPLQATIPLLFVCISVCIFCRKASPF